MIELRNLTKHFTDHPAVSDISLTVPEGGFLVLLGPSGCGKSTLLRMLAGLDQPTFGQIHMGGRLVADGAKTCLPPEHRNAGLVFQSYALWPHMTVAGNVDWPLKVARLPDRAARVAEALQMMGIADLADRNPSDISGGQQQRVALARMIAQRPKVMLFDEPLSNLDATLRVEMRQEIARLHNATGATTVYVTHDQIEAMTLASHVAVLNKGRIEQFAPPQDLLDCPASAFVARFVGTPPANLIPIRAGAWFGRLPDPVLPQIEGLAMVRAEELALTGPGPRAVAAHLLESIPMMGQRLLTLQVEDTRLTAIAPPDMPLTEMMQVSLPAAPSAIFDIKGHRLP